MHIWRRSCLSSLSLSPSQIGFGAETACGHYPSVCLTKYVCVCVHVLVCVCVCVCVRVCVSVSLYLSIYLSIYLFSYLSNMYPQIAVILLQF